MNPTAHSKQAAPLSPLAIYRGYLVQGKLAYQHDGETGQAVFYPRVIGPVSGNTDLQWRVSAARGTVYATTVVYPRGEAPYNVVLVDVDEGFRMMSRVEGILPEDVWIGMRVRARVHHADDGQPPYPVFELEVA